MIGTYEIGLQSNSSYADKMVYNELYGTGYEETFAAPEKIAAVSPVGREPPRRLRPRPGEVHDRDPAG